MTRRRPRVFLDASVVIAAILGPSGGSAAVINLARGRSITLALTEMILQEARLNVQRKAGRAELRQLVRFAVEFKRSVKQTPTEVMLRRYDRLIIDANDRHVLAGAAQTKSTVLLTLDRRHFMTETLRRAKLPFRIQTPGEFLIDLRSKIE